MGPRGSILESKALSNLRNLGDNKGNFREWRDKFKNLLGEIRQGTRDVISWVETLKSEDDLTRSAFDGEVFIPEWDKINEELYVLLIDKTEGGARERVKSVPG